MRVRLYFSTLRKIVAILSIIVLTVPPASPTNLDRPRTGVGESRNANYKRARSSQSGAMPIASMMPMPMVAPLFVQDRQFSSTLGMVNASNVSTFADVALTDLSGKQIAVKRVQFTPHSQQHLDILSVLESSVSPATTGRLTISQDPSLQGMAIGAQLSITFTGARNTNYIDEEVAMPSAEGS